MARDQKKKAKDTKEVQNMLDEVAIGDKEEGDDKKEE